MDPLTQGVFGSLWAQAGSRRRHLHLAAGAGFVAGMAADLDVLIRSPDDSLLAIDYHRHFTHAIPFAPLGALLVALALWPLLGRKLGFALLYLFCFLGYLSHGILDSFTSYGTYLWWPFFDSRITWNWISVIDPLFTLPLILLLAAAAIRRRRLWHGLAVAWAVLYLGWGGVQQYRAEQTLLAWAQAQGMSVEAHVAKPAFANLVLWRGVLDDGESLQAVAIRQLPFAGTQIYPGESVPRLETGDLPEATRLARDLRRFDVFSGGWLFRYPPEETGDDWFVGDFRYAIDPASARPLWGIRFNPGETAAGVQFERLREVDATERERFMNRLRGKLPARK